VISCWGNPDAPHRRGGLLIHLRRVPEAPRRGVCWRNARVHPIRLVSVRPKAIKETNLDECGNMRERLVAKLALRMYARVFRMCPQCRFRRKLFVTDATDKAGMLGAVVLRRRQISSQRRTGAPGIRTASSSFWSSKPKRHRVQREWLIDS